jgi:putative FmdB family regulatory protein
LPLYEYSCRECGTGFERMRRMDERLLAPACPDCSSEQTVLRLSAPAMVGGRTGEAAQSCGTSAPGGCCGGGTCMNMNLN